MASGSAHPHSAAQQQPASDTPQALKSWWNNFKKKGRKDPAPLGPPQPAPGAIFGIPLAQSIRYANVAISLMQEDGSSYTYGYIPIVVAKCGVYLKDKATEIEGIFRLAGSARRMNQLQEIFNMPDKYGKGLDWDGYTVHDAANVLRRYLNQLPEPIVPLDLYEPFREPLRQHQLQAVGNVDARESDIGNFDYDTTIATYRSLITNLPPLNRQLLLYILDMLAIFAAKSNTNHMTAANLAVIFQPGMLHHPDHDKIPGEYRLSQDVVIFLIDQQDNFLLGMPGTAADEKTRKDIESGQQPHAPATPTRAAGVLGRSVSTTSRSTNSSRLAGIRRNLSVSSRGSRASVIAAGPGTPGTPAAPGSPAIGVHRSNTVPSRKSPAVSQSRFTRPGESPSATPPAVTPDMAVSPPSQSPAPIPSVAVMGSNVPSPEPQVGSIAPFVGNSAVRDQSKERLLGNEESTANSASANKARTGLSNLLRSPASDDGQTRQPNKLRKKRQPPAIGTQPSGYSSAASLSAAEQDASRAPDAGPIASGDDRSRQVSGTSNSGVVLTETLATPRGDTTPQPIAEEPLREANAALKPQQSPMPESSESQAEKYDTSTGNELDGDGGSGAPEKEKKRRWRFSVSAKRNNDERAFSTSHGSSSHLGGYSDADLSKTSSGSWRHRGSNVNIADVPGTIESNPDAHRRRSRDNAYTSEERSPTTEASSKGPISWFKRKIKEREEKEAGKERTKSPQRGDVGRGPSSQTLDAVANGESSSRQVSTDLSSAPPAETLEGHVTTNRTIAAAPNAVHVPAVPMSQTTQTPNTKNETLGAMSSGAVPVVPGKIEDYMNDSDREKLHTAREAAKRNSLLDAGDEATTPKTSNISIDPAYKNAADTGADEVTDPEPSTPKASEVNAGLRALTSGSNPSQSSANNQNT